MKKIKLFTRDMGYVTTVNVPDFQPMAEVIIWGNRVFVLENGEYKEGLAFFALNEPVQED